MPNTINILSKKVKSMTAPKTFVLLSGAYHGGWCWAHVIRILHHQGHRVFAPSYTGSGERYHLMNVDIDGETYVQDVLCLLEAEELQDVTLVGHSISGRMISAIAERHPDPIRNLIYFDAGIPISGKSMSDDAEYWREKLKTVVHVQGVPCFAPPPAEKLGIFDEQQKQWVERRLTAVPVKVFETAFDFKHPIGNGLPKAFIRCVEPVHALATPSADLAREQRWPIFDLAAGHDAMITAPELLADMLLDIKGEAG